MDFRPSSPTSGVGEQEGEAFKLSCATETVSQKKIRIIIVKGDDDDIFEEQHQIKIEVADTPTFQSGDEDDVEFGDIQVKTEPLDTEQPSSTSSAHDSEHNQPRRRKKKGNYAFRTCPHCPFKNNNPRIYENHLRLHLPGSPARPCQECKSFVLPEHLKRHQTVHRRNAWRKRLEALRNKSKISDPLVSNSNLPDDGDQPVVVKTEQDLEVGEPEAVNLGHFSASTLFDNEDKEMKTEPISILPHSSSNLEWESASNNEHRCPFCPYTSNSRLRVQTHFKVHEEGVISVPCKNCGVHNLPKKRCTCYQRQYTPKKKTIPVNKRKPKVKKEPEWLTSPDFTGFKEESKRNYNIITLRCNYCPFTIKNSISLMRNHVKLHDPSSGAISCEICGAYVLPKKMKLHVALRHPPQLPKPLRSKMSKGKRKPNPDFTVKVEKCRRWYMCRKCPYKSLRRGEIDTHARLHLEGSSAIPCELCNISVLPEQMELHQATDHPVLQPKEPIVKKVPVVFKCAHCPHEAKLMSHFESHSILHLEGSGGIPCPECDVYYIPNPTCFRHRCGKWKTLKILRLVKAKRSMSQNESSTQLPIAD